MLVCVIPLCDSSTLVTAVGSSGIPHNNRGICSEQQWEVNNEQILRDHSSNEQQTKANGRTKSTQRDERRAIEWANEEERERRAIEWANGEERERRASKGANEEQVTEVGKRRT